MREGGCGKNSIRHLFERVKSQGPRVKTEKNKICIETKM
jgi:hypothetical protein